MRDDMCKQNKCKCNSTSTFVCFVLKYDGTTNPHLPSSVWMGALAIVPRPDVLPQLHYIHVFFLFWIFFDLNYPYFSWYFICTLILFCGMRLLAVFHSQNMLKPFICCLSMYDIILLFLVLLHNLFLVLLHNLSCKVTLTALLKHFMPRAISCVWCEDLN